MRKWFRFFSFFKKRKAVILVDWENMFINFGGRKGFNLDLEVISQGFLKLKEQISQEIKGKVIGPYIFASSHSAFLSIWEETFYKLKFPVISCPKIIEMIDGKEEERDTVDEILMQEGRKLINNMSLTHLCVASGDKHYVPFYQEAHSIELSTITIYASQNSLARELMEVSDKIIEFPLV